MSFGTLFNLCLFLTSVGLIIAASGLHIPKLPEVKRGAPKEIGQFRTSINSKLLSRLRRIEVFQTASAIFFISIVTATVVLFESKLIEFIPLTSNRKPPELELDKLTPQHLTQHLECFNPSAWIIIVLIILAVVVFRSTSISSKRSKGLVNYFVHNQNHSDTDRLFLTWLWNEKDILPRIAKGSIRGSVKKAVNDVWNGSWATEQQNIADTLCTNIDELTKERKDFRDFVSVYAPKSSSIFFSALVSSLAVIIMWGSLQLRIGLTCF